MAKSNYVSQLQADIKRTNTRISAIAQKFGTESSAYKQATKVYQSKKYVPYVHETKNGVLQISSKLAQEYATGEPTQGTKLPHTYLLRAQLSKTPTITAIQSQTAEELKIDYKEFTKLSTEEIKQEVEKVQQIREKFTATKELFYKKYTKKQRKEKMKNTSMYGKRGEGNTASYDDLKEYMNQMNKLIDKALTDEPTINGEPISDTPFKKKG